MSKHHKTEPKSCKSCCKTSFACAAPEAQSVFLAGTFNGWDPKNTSMERQDDGTWRTSFELNAGRHEYKFVVDGVWCCEPGNEDGLAGEGCVPNPFGTMNRIVEVQDSPEPQAKTATAT